MTDYIRQHEDPRHAFERRETERLCTQFETDATVIDGIVRWNANATVPPKDVLLLWQHLGKPFSFEASLSTRQTETDAFIARYREENANRVRSAEELIEMRACFGEGTEVVDVVSGQRMRV